MAKAVLMTMAVVAIPVIVATGANASTHAQRPAVSGLHLDSRIDGQRTGIHIDRHGLSAWFSDKHLGIKQGLSISC